MSCKNWKGRVQRIWKWYLPICISPSLSVNNPHSLISLRSCLNTSLQVYLKASSAVIVPSTSFTVKACHSWKKENALSFDQVEQMLFNFMKQKQTWKSNYSTVRLFFLVWSSLNFPSVFLCIIGCVIWPVGRFLVHSRSSFLPLYVNLFSYLVSKCWPNYSRIMLLVKGICSTEVPHRERSIC